MKKKYTLAFLVEGIPILSLTGLVLSHLIRKREKNSAAK